MARITAPLTKEQTQLVKQLDVKNGKFTYSGWNARAWINGVMVEDEEESIRLSHVITQLEELGILITTSESASSWVAYINRRAPKYLKQYLAKMAKFASQQEA